MPVLTTLWTILPIALGFLTIPVYNAQKNLINLITTAKVANWQAMLAAALPSLILFAVASILQESIDIFTRYVNFFLQGKTTINIQSRIIDITTKIPYEYYDDPVFHNLLQRAQSVLGDDLVGIFNNLISSFKIMSTLLAVIVLVQSSGYWFASLIMIVMLFSNLTIKLTAEIRVRKLGREITMDGRMADYLHQSLFDANTIREMRIYGATKYFTGVWGKLIKNQHSKRYGARRNEIKLGGVTSIIHTTAVIVVLYFLTRQIGDNKVSIGLITIIFTAMLRSGWQIMSLTWPLSKLYIQGSKLFDLAEFLHYERQVSEAANSNKKIVSATELNNIEFDNVSFSYPNSSKTVLDKISLKVPKGQKIAIVGQNGAGKTTLVQLLMGLYKPDSGSIYWNERDIEKQDVLNRISVVLQDFTRYEMTLRENVALGRLKDMSNDEAILDILKQCDLESLYEELGSLDVPLGRLMEGGRELSGGQWQKLALARALIKDTDLVILDEPTSALDPSAELDLFLRFKEICKGKTAFFISHRMGWARYADRILVLEDGRIIEDGTHEQLMKQGGHYAGLFNIQASLYTS